MIILSFSVFKCSNKTRKKLIWHESSKWTILEVRNPFKQFHSKSDITHNGTRTYEK